MSRHRAVRGQAALGGVIAMEVGTGNLASCACHSFDRIRNRYAALHVARLEPGESVTVPDAPFAHVYLARGRMGLGGESRWMTGTLLV